MLKKTLKRLSDIILSLVLLILLLPLMLITALIVKVKLGGPIIFSQKRPGLYGKVFTLYKFRTMTNEKDDNGNLLPNEKRMTKTGQLIRKLSVDELPQLLNVFKGDISLIGPRPLLVEYLPLYDERQARRHDVRPGITGWAQVNGRNLIGWEERFELDLYYVDNYSILLDIKIIFITILKVFKSEGVNPEGQAFIEKFSGIKTNSNYNEHKERKNL